MEGAMKKLPVSLFAVVSVSGVFLAEAVAALPPNHWHHLPKN
jgi:hypothetical protein